MPLKSLQPVQVQHLYSAAALPARVGAVWCNLHFLHFCTWSWFDPQLGRSRNLEDPLLAFSLLLQVVEGPSAHSRLFFCSSLPLRSSHLFLAKKVQNVAETVGRRSSEWFLQLGRVKSAILDHEWVFSAHDERFMRRKVAQRHIDGEGIFLLVRGHRDNAVRVAQRLQNLRCDLCFP